MKNLSLRFAVLLAVAAATLSQAEARTQLACLSAFNGTPTSLDRKADTGLVDFDSTASYLTEFQRQNVNGKVIESFDHELDTRIYVANNGLPDADGNLPFVDPNSRGVMIFLHGSGTARSSGKNFLHLMNTLTSLNVSTIALDLPFHADGPLSEKFNDPSYVTAWLNKIVTRARAAGVPVYLTGHSFGPSLIMEYLYDYPRGVDGALLISPVAFNPELKSWYDTQTSRMRFGDAQLIDHTMGGVWGDLMLSKFRTHQGKKLENDPTQINPNLKVHVLTGNREEYAEAPLAGRRRLPVGPNTYSIPQAITQLLARASVRLEQGVGHYIFKHKDAKDQNVVLRELTDLLGIDLSSAPEIKKEVLRVLNDERPLSDQIWVKYASDRLFKSWADRRAIGRILPRVFREKDSALAKRILDQYKLDRESREASILARVVEVAEADPAIAARYASEIRELTSAKGMKDSPLFNLLLNRL